MSTLRRDRLELDSFGSKKFAFEFTSNSSAFIEALDVEDNEHFMPLELDDMIALAEWLGDAIKYKTIMNERADATEVESTRKIIEAATQPDKIPF